VNQGEICLCGERLLVQRGIFDKFVDKFVTATKAWTVGDPKEASSNIGALISDAHLSKCLSYVQLAKELGGTVRCGGERVNVPGRCAKGFFFSPCVITDLPAHCRVNQVHLSIPFLYYHYH